MNSETELEVGFFFCYYSSLQLMALKHVSTDDVNDTPPPSKKKSIKSALTWV